MSIPYLANTGNLTAFLTKIPRIAVPEKLTQKTLYALGYKSTNDRPIITVLKFINFLNTDGTPNDNYINFRISEKAGGVMAECLKNAYSDVFGIYTDANRRNDDELRDAFRISVTAGEQVLNNTVRTFKTLCEFANFEANSGQSTDNARDKIPPKSEPKSENQIPSGLTMNVNIQITLPITDDAKVYENIFKALKENIFN